MANDFGGKVETGGFDYRELQKLSALLDDSVERERKAAESIFNYKLGLLKKELGERQEIQNRLAKLGLNQIKAESDARQKALKKEKDARLREERKKYKDGANAAEYKAFKAQLDKEYKLREIKEKELAEKKQKWATKYTESALRNWKAKESKEEAKRAASELLGKDKTFRERQAGLKELTSDQSKLINAVSDLAKQMEIQVDKVASKKSLFDTRLQGSKNATVLGSYWDRMSQDIVGIAGISPYITQESIVSNLETLVNKGIAYNVEQRAFLMTIKDKIANTFDVADATLLRLVRIQQQDSTAARLGMESAMTAFLNNMYETTEYLTDIASSIRSNLTEVEALMGAEQAAELEYQVQKWMGSLYSVGMSQEAVSNISRAFGQIAAGDISGLTGSGTGNLLIMAANQAGLSIEDILASGLSSKETNKLLNAMVQYLQEIAVSSADSRVVQQQLAKVYGLTASDLRAALNIGRTESVKNTNNLSYQGGINQLYNMAGSMWKRTSMGEMMSNVWSNFQYSMAASMASNPVTYLLYKTATLLDDVAGGIAIPAISVAGFMVDLETTVADLMRVGALSGGILTGLGNMIGNLSAGGGLFGSGMLKALGITGYSKVEHGGGYTPIAASGASISESGTLVGNSDSSAIMDKTMGTASDTKESQMAEATKDESDALTNKDLDERIYSIYRLLEPVFNGTASIRVSRDDGFAWSNPSTN